MWGLWLRYTLSPSAARELLAAPLEHSHQEGTLMAATTVSPRWVTPLRGHPKPH